MESQRCYATGGRYDIYVRVRIRFPAEGRTMWDTVTYGETKQGHTERNMMRNRIQLESVVTVENVHAVEVCHYKLNTRDGKQHLIEKLEIAA